MDEPRALAFEIIDRVLNEEAYLHLLLRSSFSANRVNEKDRAFVTELATGTIRYRAKIDHALSFYLDRPSEAVDARVLSALRMGAYQVLEMRVPGHAAVYETVEVAKNRLGRGPSSYVNAVLRKMAGDLDRIIWPEPGETLEYISVMQSHPEWLVEYLIDTFGSERALSLCVASNRKAPLTIRVNTLRHPVDEYSASLKERGVEFTPGRYLPEALTNLHLPGNMLAEEWDKGNFVVQDESSMLVSRIVDPQPQEFIIDTCAAPGGKTTHLSQLTGERADILAIDNKPRRLEALEKMARNLGLDSIRYQAADARGLRKLAGRQAQRILVDAPCSGLGTLRRRPDMKWKRRPEDLLKMAAVQAELLNAAAVTLSPGGVLVYSVCTITPEETVDQVASFLSSHPDFRLEDPGPFCPLGVPLPQERSDIIQTYPDLHSLDGMFIARMRKS